MGSLDGVYLLSDAATNDELVLEDGDWYFGHVRALKAGHDSIYRTWLVTSPPNAAHDTYVLLNVQSGTFAGIWKDEWGNGDHHVKCSPSLLSAANIQWRATDILSEPARAVFNWDVDPPKVLSRHGISIAAISTNISTHWRLEPKRADFDTRSNWMSRVPHDLKLHEINIPTTHQSLANHGISKVRPDLDWNHLGDGTPRPWGKLPTFIDNPRCQESSLWDQLQMGIRGFDIRLDLDCLPFLKRVGGGKAHEERGYFLYARHGLAEIGHSWSAALLVFRHFLKSNPSEFVLVNVRYEKSTDGSRDRSKDWMSAFIYETSPFWSEPDPTIYKWWERGAPIMNDLSLANARGKMILTCDDSYMPSDGQEGRHPGARFFPHDMSAVGKYDSHRDQWDQQLQDCENNLNAAKTEGNPQRYFQTSLNVSGLPAPLKYAMAAQTLFKNPLHPFQDEKKAKQDASNEVFDPIDFFSYFRDKWAARGDECPFSEKRLGKNGQFRVGKVDLDFCNRMQDWVGNIVRSNRTMPGKEW